MDRSTASDAQPDAHAPAAPGDSDLEELVLTLIASRHNLSPKRLVAPAPNDAQLHAMLEAAAAAPDHGQLTPWRFVVVPEDRRHRLGEAFAQALLERDPAATAEQVAEAREKANRAPLLLIAIARLGPREPDTPALERMVSMGAAIQNLLLAAHAMGFGTGLTSGRAMSSAPMARLCALGEGEAAVCCINVGTATSRPQPKRVRPLPPQFVSVLAPDDGAAGAPAG